MTPIYDVSYVALPNNVRVKNMVHCSRKAALRGSLLCMHAPAVVIYKCSCPAEDPPHARNLAFGGMYSQKVQRLPACSIHFIAQLPAYHPLALQPVNMKSEKVSTKRAVRHGFPDTPHHPCSTVIAVDTDGSPSKGFPCYVILNV